MLKCLVIDDEPLAISLLSDYVKKTDGLELAGSFTNPIEALHFIEETAVDLLFLDIQMPELTGLQFGKILRGRIPIILTTAYEEYALQGYELDVIDYLVKPISFERFLMAVQKARSRVLPSPTEPVQASVANTSNYIFVKTNYKTQRINLDEILYLEGLGDYVQIHLPDERVLTLMNMKDLVEMLPAERFMRVHKSYLVAFDKIDYIERNRILINGQRIPIGPTYQEAFWKRIQPR